MFLYFIINCKELNSLRRFDIRCLQLFSVLLKLVAPRYSSRYPWQASPIIRVTGHVYVLFLIVLIVLLFLIVVIFLLLILLVFFFLIALVKPEGLIAGVMRVVASDDGL